MIFFGRHVANPNIRTLWFPFSAAPDFSFFVPRNVRRHRQLLGGVRRGGPVDKAGVPLASLDKARLWIPGKKKEGSRDRREAVMCPRHRFSFRKTIVLLLVELCSLLFEQPSRNCARWTSSCVRKPAVPSCCWGFFVAVVSSLLLLLLMRLIIIITTKMPKILP